MDQSWGNQFKGANGMANCRMCPENSVTSEGANGMANYKVYISKNSRKFCYL